MEIWKEIPGYIDLYEASNTGKIRTKEGKVTKSARFERRVWKQRILKQKYKKAKNGRLDAMVTLWKDGKPFYHLVSRLIAATFHENMLNTNYTVNHKDGNPLNNNESNLEWLTRQENIKYGFKNGQFAHIMKPITATNEKAQTLFACSLAEMDRQLGQYRGYTSRMTKANSIYLYNKAGERFKINPF